MDAIQPVYKYECAECGKLYFEEYQPFGEMGDPLLRNAPAVGLLLLAPGTVSGTEPRWEIKAWFCSESCLRLWTKHSWLG